MLARTVTVVSSSGSKPTARRAGSSDLALLRLQRQAGNAAVARAMAGAPGRTSVQRCGATPPAECPCRDAEEREAAEPAGERDGTTGGQHQSAGAVVQRAGDFEISGVQAAPGETTNVYFDRNVGTIPAGEQPKIPAIIAAKGAANPLFLDGYASEDEPAALAATRASTVSTALGAATPPHTGTRTTRNVATRGRGRIDYRRMRKVEVQSPTGVTPPPPTAPTSLTRPCGGALAAARPRAVALLTSAIGALSAPLTPAVTSLLRDLFGGPTGPPAAGTIQANLSALKHHIDVEIGPPGTVACHTLLDGRCNNPAYNVGVGAGAVMTLCPGFLDNPGAVEANAATLIHEAGHGTTGLATVDLAYGHTRLVRALTTAQALTNTDSYVLLVRNIAAGLAGTAPVPIGVAGDVRAGMTAAEDQTATIALAHAEKWLTQSYQDLLSLYTTVHASRAAGAWTGPTAGYDQETMRRLAPHFGLTSPGAGPVFALPTATDQRRLAAIHDRFLAMRSVMWGRPVTMTKAAGPGSETWAPGPGATVTLRTPFFTLPSTILQIHRLIELLAGAHPDISGALRPHYVTAADTIRAHRGLGP